MPVVAIDGVIVSEDRAAISVFDRGFLYGDGLFEVLRTWGGRAVDLQAHLDRMCASAAALELAIDRAAIAHAVELVLAVVSGEQRLKLIVTRGPGGPAMRLAAGRDGRTIVIAEPLQAAPTELSAAIVDYALPRRATGHKTLAYLDHLIAKELAAAAGADEAFRLGPDGDVVEGATSNLFIVRAGLVATPPLAGVLSGITRAHVADCCVELGIPIVERKLAIAEIHDADEIFVTSAVRGVCAITRLDGRVRGPAVGQVTQKLAQAYATRMSRATMTTSRHGS